MERADLNALFRAQSHRRSSAFSHGTPHPSLVEIYDITPAGPPTVSITATIASANKSGSKPGEFTFTRSGDTGSALTVNYSVGGYTIVASGVGHTTGTALVEVYDLDP